MLELRQAAAELIANPLVPVPPLEGVAARARAYRAARRRRQVGASVALVALVVTAVARATLGGIGHDTLRTVGDPSRYDDDAPAGSTTSMVPGLGDGSSSPFVPWSGQSFERDWSELERKRPCAVTRPPTPELKVLVRDATPGNAHVDAVKALVDDVNASGGICGRLIKLVQGSAMRQSLHDYVAVLGLPFDNDLDTAIATGHIAKAGVPVVSGDGLTQVQHRSRFVYPVGPSAAAMTRTAIEHARNRGAKSFAIVYEAEHAFGREAAASFEEYVGRDGDALKASIAWHPSADGYGPQADRLTSACGVEGCDFILLALLSETAKEWLRTNPTKPKVQLAGLSPILSGDLSDHCAATSDEQCDGLVAWSGYEPWTPARWWNVEADYAFGDRHKSALRAGAVVAARVLYEALELAGPDATRREVRRALDSLTFTSRITPPLAWPGDRLSQAWLLRTTGLVPHVEPPADAGASGLWAAQQRDKYDALLELKTPQPYWHPAGTGWVRDPG